MEAQLGVTEGEGESRLFILCCGGSFEKLISVLEGHSVEIDTTIIKQGLIE